MGSVKVVNVSNVYPAGGRGRWTPPTNGLAEFRQLLSG
jgi:hypothetical protein